MSLKFMKKKSWHVTNLNNVEEVWKAEERKKEETKKLAELEKQIKDEHEILELRRMSAAGGNVKPVDTTLDWMYKGVNSKNDKEETNKISTEEAEEYLLGKAFEGQKKTKSLLQSSKKGEEQKIPSLLANKSEAFVKNDNFARLHEDPLLAIKRREKEERTRIANNPYQRSRIPDTNGTGVDYHRKSGDSKSHKRKKEKKEKTDRKERKREKKEKKKRSKERKREKREKRENERRHDHNGSHSHSHSDSERSISSSPSPSSSPFPSQPDNDDGNYKKSNFHFSSNSNLITTTSTTTTTTTTATSGTSSKKELDPRFGLVKKSAHALRQDTNRNNDSSSSSSSNCHGNDDNSHNYDRRDYLGPNPELLARLVASSDERCRSREDEDENARKKARNLSSEEKKQLIMSMERDAILADASRQYRLETHMTKDQEECERDRDVHDKIRSGKGSKAFLNKMRSEVYSTGISNDHTDDTLEDRLSRHRHTRQRISDFDNSNFLSK